MKSKNDKNNAPRIAFFGTPLFATVILDTLISSKFSPILVVTKPDAPIGRKKIMTSSPVKVLAEKNNIPVLTPQKLDDAFFDIFKSYGDIDIAIVAAYGKIFPKLLLNIPLLGCINVHASLLPLYRGASPIQHTLLDGHTLTGITLMQMEAGLDTGPILATNTLSIDPHDTTETLTPKLAKLGSQLLIKTLPDLLFDKSISKPQDHTKATHCSMITKEDGHIDWHVSAQMVYNRYRAFTPWPGIFSFWNNAPSSIRIRFLRIRPSNRSFENSTPGTVYIDNKSLFVVCGDKKTIELELLQREGKPPTSASAFIAGYSNIHGTLLQ